ncbi:MAG: ABC transporter permease [Deltaproteobacteria bacterium]|nr:ABC transporter permease [Deltaproteobacteria bacterium]
MGYILYFLARRSIQGLVIIFFAVFLIFMIMRIVPGDPVRLMVGGAAPDQVLERVAKELGLKDPLLVQFGRYLKGIVHGDFGTSFIRPKSGGSVGGEAWDDKRAHARAEVIDLIIERIPLTLLLGAMSIGWAVVIGIPFGIIAAIKQGSWIDKIANAFISFSISMPNFWVGIILMLIVSIRLKILPSVGYKGFTYVILPSFAVSLELAPILLRTIRASMIDVLKLNFVKVAKARGLAPAAILLKHCFRNSLVPLLNVMGVQIGILLGGVIVVEFVFNYPGLGLLTIYAVLQRDFPLIQGIVILFASVFVFINIIVDLLCSYVDRRIEF